MIVNPISYPGNKAKLIKQIIPEIGRDGSCFVDVFCGSGMVAANTAFHKLFCNDISSSAMNLLKYMYNTSSVEIIESAEKLIEKYGLTYSKNKPKGFYIEKKHEGLSRYNKQGYERLRDDFNNNPTMDKLFILMIYGFNHYMRFNSSGAFNVPVGKVDFSKSIYKNTVEFVDNIKAKDIVFSNKDFRDKSLYTEQDAVYYFDPPYLITTAPYNNNWGIEEEKALLSLLDALNNEHKKFALSNVFLSNGKKNKILKAWSKNYFVKIVKRQYRNANYQKKNITDSIEVIIKNF